MQPDVFRTIVETLPQMIWTAIPDGKIDYVNSICLLYTGATTIATFSQEWPNFIHPEDTARVGRAWVASMQNGTPFAEHYRIRRQDGTYRWFDGYATAVKDGHGKISYWVGHASDIDAQKKAIESLHVERLLREQFVSMLTHDLRNPFSAAKITAQLLARQSHSPEKIKNLTGRIISSLNRANQMIENLLDSNRIKAGIPLHLDMEEVEFPSLIHAAIEEVKKVYGDRFKIEIGAISSKCHGNADAIKRIVENLCTNAAQFGLESSPIKVTLREVTPYILITVHNIGNPISPEDQSQIFDSDRKSLIVSVQKSKGWGLGLILARGLAIAHGGTIEVASDPETGTLFTVKLLCEPHEEKL